MKRKLEVLFGTISWFNVRAVQDKLIITSKHEYEVYKFSFGTIYFDLDLEGSNEGHTYF